MPIPKEILAVERPKSTRVLLSHGRYLVIKRTSKRVDGKIKPVDLGTIGEIKDGKYIEIRKEPRKNKDGTRNIAIKDYGEVALCNKVGEGILDDLKEVFDPADAIRIYTIALLRSAYKNITDREIQLAYETSFASEMYPKVHLSENTICDFLEKTGMAYDRIRKFMKKRVEKFSGKDIVIDGMLKDCNGETDAFSEFSRKGHTKGSKDLSLIYAFDPQTKEPIAAKPYPGNVLDLVSICDFVDDYNVKNGMLVMDKGFYAPDSINTIKEKKNLSYLIPLKQNCKKIKDNEMDKDVSSLLDTKEYNVLWKKKCIAKDSYLYSFLNPKDAYEQQIGYITREKNNGTYSEEKYQMKKQEFGLIVFESNKDLNPLDVYEAYAKRWEIEVMFSFYKNIIELEKVRVHGDYRIYATEFINFISLLISSKVKSYLRVKEISKKFSYKQVFHFLSKAKMVKNDDSKSWSSSCTVKYISEMIKKLGV